MKAATHARYGTDQLREVVDIVLAKYKRKGDAR